MYFVTHLGSIWSHYKFTLTENSLDRRFDEESRPNCTRPRPWHPWGRGRGRGRIFRPHAAAAGPSSGS